MAMNNFMANLYKYSLLALLILLVLVVASCNNHSVFSLVFTVLLILLIIILFNTFYPTTENMANITFAVEENTPTIYLPHGDQSVLGPIGVAVDYKKEGTSCPPFDIAYNQGETYISPLEPSIFEDNFDQRQRGSNLADRPGSAQSANNLILSPVYTKGYFMENNCEYADYNLYNQCDQGDQSN